MQPRRSTPLIPWAVVYGHRWRKEFIQIWGQTYKPLFRSISWPKAAGQSKQTRQSISHIFNPFSSSGVYMPSCRDQGKRLAGLGLGFTFSEPCCDSGRKATRLGQAQEQKHPVPGVSCQPQPRLWHHEFISLSRDKLPFAVVK